MKTYPEMNAKIVSMLRIGGDPSGLYAAQLIEELQAELTRAKADCAIKEIAIVDAIHTIYDLFPEVVSQPLINRAQQSLALLRQVKLLTAGQDLLDQLTAKDTRIAELEAENNKLKEMTASTINNCDRCPVKLPTGMMID